MNYCRTHTDETECGCNANYRRVMEMPIPKDAPPVTAEATFSALDRALDFAMQVVLPSVAGLCIGGFIVWSIVTISQMFF